MSNYKIIKMGDREGNGAIVEHVDWFSVKTWTANNDDKGFEKWVCRETGEFKFKGVYCKIDFFYVAQYDTLSRGEQNG
ncbi:hypothetical protein AB0118_07300 [Klebsiella quasipneumoniae]|uniref:hypothetical protein n=1 Tax=Klebsiella quasipneumoniae TaxID=1463165 RepID=UPI00344EA47D